VGCVGVCNGQLMLLGIGLADEVMSSTRIKEDDDGVSI
jgi:hypothetical protein